MKYSNIELKDIKDGFILLESRYSSISTDLELDTNLRGFYEKYPGVYEACNSMNEKEDTFGGLFFIELNDNLTVYHSFTQRSPGKQHVQKSLRKESEQLIKNIMYVLNKASKENKKLYVPKYIGASFGKHQWRDIEKSLKTLSDDLVIIDLEWKEPEDDSEDKVLH